MKAGLFLLGLLSVSWCAGQQLGTVPAALRSGAYENGPQHALHFIVNQATLGNVKTFAAAVYGERQFLLQELSLYHVALTQPAGAGAFGLHMAYAGDADYTSSKLGLAYGRKLTDNTSLGIQFNYLAQHIRGYGTAAQLTVEGGLLFRLSEVFQAGFQWGNAASALRNKALEKVPALYTVGVGYQPSENVGLTTELCKTAKVPLAIRSSVTYRFAKALWAKAGISSSTAAFFVAAGFQLNGLQVEVMGSVHPHLGLTPGLLMAYNNMDK